MIVRDQKRCVSLSPQTPCEHVMLSHQEIVWARARSFKRNTQKCEELCLKIPSEDSTIMKPQRNIKKELTSYKQLQPAMLFDGSSTTTCGRSGSLLPLVFPTLVTALKGLARRWWARGCASVQHVIQKQQVADEVKKHKPSDVFPALAALVQERRRETQERSSWNAGAIHRLIPATAEQTVLKHSHTDRNLPDLTPQLGAGLSFIHLSTSGRMNTEGGKCKGASATVGSDIPLLAPWAAFALPTNCPEPPPSRALFHLHAQPRVKPPAPRIRAAIWGPTDNVLVAYW